MSAAPLPIWWRSTIAAWRPWKSSRRPPRTRRSGCSTGSICSPRRLGLERAALLGETERIVHGTTVATNALLERKGARVGLLTTEGHRDVIEMREGLKDDRYNLRLPPPEQLVPRRLRLGVRERLRADGRVETPLDRASLDAAIAVLKTRAGRGGGGVLPARLARPEPRARDARGNRTRAAWRLCLAVVRGAAADQGIRAGLDDGRQRLCRAGCGALSRPPRKAARRSRVCGARP